MGVWVTKTHSILLFIKWPKITGQYCYRPRNSFMARWGQFFRNEASLRSEVVLLHLHLVAVLLKSKYEGQQTCQSKQRKPSLVSENKILYSKCRPDTCTWLDVRDPFWARNGHQTDGAQQTNISCCSFWMPSYLLNKLMGVEANICQ